MGYSQANQHKINTDPNKLVSDTRRKEDYESGWDLISLIARFTNSQQPGITKCIFISLYQAFVNSCCLLLTHASGNLPLQDVGRLFEVR